MPKKNPPRLKMFLVHKDGTEEELNFNPNWDAMRATQKRIKRMPEIRRLGQGEKRGIFRRLGDD